MSEQTKLRWEKKVGVVKPEEEGLWGCRNADQTGRPWGIYKSDSSPWNDDYEYAGPLEIAEPRHECERGALKVREDNDGYLHLVRIDCDLNVLLPFCPLCATESQAHKAEREAREKGAAK